MNNNKSMDRAWKEWIMVSIFSLLLYYDVLYKLVIDWWNDENYSHGLLIPFVLGYIVWQKKENLKSLTPSTSPSGIILFIIGLFLFILGRFGAEYYMTRFSFLLILSGAMLFLLGGKTFLLILPCFILFALSIPLPYLIYDAIAFPLRLLASSLAGNTLVLLGVPVISEGNIIQLSTMTLSVEDACSGIRSLMSFITIGTLMLIFSSTGKLKKVIFMVSTIGIAIIANAMRIVGTGLLSNYVNPKYGEGFFHIFSGWAIFIFGLTMQIGVFYLLSSQNKT